MPIAYVFAALILSTLAFLIVFIMTEVITFTLMVIWQIIKALLMM